MRNKILFYLLLAPLLAAALWTASGALGARTSYAQAQKRNTDTQTARQTAQALNAIEHEAFVSMMYLGRSGKNFLPEVREARQKSDHALAQLPQEGTEASAEDLAQSLKYIRADVDGLSDDYVSLLIQKYEKEIIDPLLLSYKHLRDRFTAPVLQHSISAQSVLMDAQALWMKEKALLGHVLARKKRLDDVAVVAWEKMLGEGFAPNWSSVKDPELITRLNKTLQLDASEQAIKMLRADVLYHALDGQFSMELQNVEKSYAPLLDHARVAMRDLETLRSNDANALAQATKVRLMQYAASFVGVLLLMLFLVRAFGNADKERQALEATLRGMVQDLDEGRQSALDDIIKKGDRLAIYRFLSEATREAHEAREQALAAEKAKDLFLANMSHEIRTPLNGIVGFTQLLESTHLDNEQRGFTEIIKGSSDNLLSIVNSILDLSKIRAEKMDLESIAFSPLDIFGDTVEPHEVQSSEKKVGYTAFIDPHLPMLLGDPTRLRQIMTNLIGNALKFTDTGGSIDVSIEMMDESETDAVVQFSVKDTGIGISAEQQEKIFEAFSQADSSTTREFGGTGLGLAITSDLIKHMGGKLQVDSELGNGAEFHFSLTLKKAGKDEESRHDFDDLRIAYYHPDNVIERTFDKGLIRYLRAISPHSTLIGSLDEGIERDFDVLFVDYSLAPVRRNIEAILARNIDVVVMGYISYKSEIDELVGKKASILYRPLLFSKLIKAITSVRKGHEHDHVAQPNRALARTDFSGLRVLVAEDNEVNQELIRTVLENYGTEVTVAENGQKALELRQDHAFDLVLMDIQMPVMGGIEATKAILEMEKETNAPHVPIVALTANALQGDRAKYLEAGLDDYLSKPISIERVQEVIRQHCSLPVESAAARSDDPVTPPSAPKPPASTSANSKDVLLYCRPGLIQRIHTRFLLQERFNVDIAEDEESFFRHFEQGKYAYALIHSQMIPHDNCIFLDAIREQGTRPFVYALSPGHMCAASSDARYSKIGELREILMH